MASDQEIAATLCGDHVVWSTDKAARCESCDTIVAHLATARAEGFAAGVKQAAEVVKRYFGGLAKAYDCLAAIRALTPAPAAPPRAEKE